MKATTRCIIGIILNALCVFINYFGGNEFLIPINIVAIVACTFSYCDYRKKEKVEEEWRKLF